MHEMSTVVRFVRLIQGARVYRKKDTISESPTESPLPLRKNTHPFLGFPLDKAAEQQRDKAL